MQDIASEFRGKKIFSTLDLRDGYWQIHLDKESSLLYTFSIPSVDIDSPECLSGSSL